MRPIYVSAKEFFREVVVDACAQRKLKTFPLVQGYLTSLLEYYISTDRLFDEEKQDGKKDRKTLAELYLTATNCESGVRLDLLKKLGDTSLYVSGFFGESLTRKLVDVDYYANMGELAYGSLSNFVKEDTYRAVYNDFSLRFMEYVDVLTFISQKMMIQSNENLLRLYDHYIRTGSELAKETLLEKGIAVTPPDKKISNEQ